MGINGPRPQAGARTSVPFITHKPPLFGTRSGASVASITLACRGLHYGPGIIPNIGASAFRCTERGGAAAGMHELAGRETPWQRISTQSWRNWAIIGPLSGRSSAVCCL